MKKLLLFGLMTVALVSCQSDMSKVEKLVKEFSEAQKTDAQEKISELYPDAVGLGLRIIDAKDAKVSFNEADSTYLVTLTDGTTMDVEKQTDDTFVITDSHNLVDWDEVWMNVFQSSGAIKNGMSDMTIKPIVYDDNFLNYLIAQNPKAMQGNLVVAAAVGEHIYDTDYHVNVDIRNESSYNYGHKDYSIEIAVLDFNGNVMKTEVCDGYDIRSGETDNFIASFNGEYCRNIASHKVTVIMRAFDDINKLNNFGEFTGDEYKNYLSTK